MINYNKDEFGQLIYADMGQDVSTASELKLILQAQVSVNGDKSEIVTGVTVGAANVDVNDETFLANQYLQYTIKDGDLNKAGLWRVKGEALLSSTNRVIGDYRTFTVAE